MSDNNRMLLNKLLHVQNWIYQCFNIYIYFFLIIRIINTCVVYCAHPLEYAARLFWALFWSTKFTVMKIRAAFI